MRTSSNGHVDVILVEDHPAMRQGLELLLRQQGVSVVGTAASADAGYELFAATRPAVSIVDLDLDGGSGIELVTRLLALDAGAGVLVYTGAHGREVSEAVTRSGARGYVRKAQGFDVLLHAIRTVAAGGTYFEPAAAGGGPARLLTARERQVLGRLAAGETGEQVAAALVLAPETVRTHVRNAMRKLGATTRVQAVAIALRLGEITPVR